MQLLTEINLENLYPISIGAALLGTGGGGDPKIGYLMAKQAIQKYGAVKLLQVDDLADEQIVAALSMMGAPSVALEKMPNGCESELLFDGLEQLYDCKIDGLYPVEAGGINSMIPIVAAARTQTPLIDGDTMGRAFPELQMVTFAIYKINTFPVLLANEKGEVVKIDAKDYYDLEQQARAWTTQMGSSVSVGDGLTDGKTFKKIAIKQIVSLSYHLGQAILNSERPFEKLEEFGAIRLFSGKLVDIVRKTEGGFNKGIVRIEGIEEEKGKTYHLHLQNENLAVYEGDSLLCSVPDLICLVDLQTAMPLTTDSYKYGQRVVCLAFNCDPKWQTAEGLEIVGPQAFGLNHDYQPIVSKKEKNV